MSKVYLATHQRLHKSVALKMVKPCGPGADELLEAEARILASLDHPGLASVLDFFEEGGHHYLVMDYIEGRDLERTAELAPQPLRERRVLQWARELLSILEYLHTQEPPVVVRDLKPSNIMLGRDGRLRLIDFGLAKFHSAEAGTQVFAKGMGSEGYSPIEQYGQGRTDQRSDLYSLGATLYFLLTDQAPLPAAERAADQVELTDPRTLNESVSEITWLALQKMLELKPENRPDSAVEAARLLGLSKDSEAARRSVEAERAAALAAKSKGRDCPDCPVRLVPERYLKVEIDHCPQCGGVWLDRGELETIVERAVPRVETKRAKATRQNDSSDLLESRRLKLDDTDDLDSGRLKKRKGRPIWERLLDLIFD